MWRRRIGWTMVVVGALCLTAGMVWIAIVAGDDAARMAAAGPIAGLIIAGILGVVWGVLTIAGDSGIGF